MRRSFKWTTGLFVLAFAAALALWGGPVLAATYQWDSGGVSPPSDNSGNWTRPLRTGTAAELPLGRRPPATPPSSAPPPATAAAVAQRLRSPPPSSLRRSIFSRRLTAPPSRSRYLWHEYLGFSSASSAINLSVASACLSHDQCRFAPVGRVNLWGTASSSTAPVR